MRYFYTDPLAAAWMTAKHGVGIHGEDGLDWPLDDMIHEAGVAWQVEPSPSAPYQWEQRFYVAAQNLRLLEPKIGDILRLHFFTPAEDDAAGAVMSGVYAGGGEAVTWFRNPRDGSIDKEVQKISDHQWRIIQRNGVAFHWPEREEL